MLDLRDGSWEIVPFDRHRTADKYVDSLERGEAEDFQRQYRSDAMTVAQLREFLTQTEPAHRMTDDQVIEMIASRLASRQLLLRVTPRRWEGDPTGGDENNDKSSAPSPPPAASSSAAKTTAPEPSSFGAGHDSEAQAAALVAAAESGVPFCQECEKQNRAAA
jgi:hypothetical protein